MNQEEFDYLVNKFLSGSISPEEKEKLERWYGSFEKEEDFTDRMREDDQRELRNSILKKIREEAFNENSKGIDSSSYFQSHWMKFIPWAASLVLILGLAYVFYYPALKEVNYQTGLGELLILKLPDSTEVVLNGNSTLSYQPTWLGKFDRKVVLDGEAFFEVFHTIENKRFTINEGQGMGIEVYGTEFNYNARDGKNAVALKAGSVKVMLPNDANDKSKSHFIKPGEVASYNLYSKEVKIDAPSNIEKYYSWKDGKLILDYSTLPEIIEELKGTYGIRISMDTSNWRDHKVSGTLPLHRDPEALIENLEQLFDVEIEITEE
ncbi:FecR family protein [Echinicola sp. 20G]|uniref:FecR family protein n=1 Tax=Echinicola sp. 20G TaxID=2781961 RepID=UPI001910D00F|nr:FecR domain-containing protein [Echinicola sp. 20G]